MKISPIAALAALVAVCSTAPACQDANAVHRTSPPVPAPSTTTLAAVQDSMRELWFQNAVWTRSVLISQFASLGDVDAAQNRLYTNEVGMADTFKPYVGQDTGDKLVSLFGNLATAMTGIIDAAKANDSGALESSTSDWTTNADEIARLLGASNSSFSEADLKAGFHETLKRTLLEISARSKNDFSTEIGAFETVEAQGMSMADFWAQGLAAGYPSLVTTSSPPSADQQTLHLAMRQTWDENVAWTRFFIISDMAQLPDLTLTKQRLLQNPMDMRDALHPYYGASSDTIAGLMMAELEDATRFVDAATSGDRAQEASARSAWNADAVRLAQAFAALNPILSEEEMQNALIDQVNRTVTEVTNRRTEDWTGDVLGYDVLEIGILQLSDTLSDAVHAQFPGGPVPPT